jgi:hypothetical protein
MTGKRHTRYTCPWSEHGVVRTAHPPGTALRCPGCHRLVTVQWDGDDAVLPQHNYLTKREPKLERDDGA